MKLGLVFSGGGSRGSYQIGVWKALEELNIKCDIVTGTSIGSINGLLYVLGDIEYAKDLWNNISFKTVFNEEFDYKNEKDNFKVNIKYLKSLKNGGIEPINLKDNLVKSIDVDKFYNSSINYGLVTVKYPKLEVVELSKNEIKKDKLIDYVIASSTVFPMFKIKNIDNNKYIDGGFKNSLPIDLAIKLGATKIIAVDISVIGRGKIKYKKTYKNKDVTIIRPNNNIGKALAFDSKIAKRNFKYGYNDTMKKYKKLYGKKYTFTSIDTYLVQKGYFKTTTKLINVIEYLGKAFEIDDTNIYTKDAFNKKIINKINDINLKRELVIKEIINVKDRIKYIYQKINKSKGKEIVKIHKLFKREYDAAYYIYLVKNSL